jgi:cytidylate kinase
MKKSEKFVITINRELGSGGRTVGRLLATRLQVKYYDKALIEQLTKKFNLSAEEIERIKGQKKTWWNEFNNYYKVLNSTVKPMEAETVITTNILFNTEKEILTTLAKEESCVVAGRSGFLVFRDHPNHLNVFIEASMEHRIERLMRKKNIMRQEAIDIINKVDKEREIFIQKYEDTSRYDTHNYHLIINMDELSEEGAVDVIMSYINAQTE